MSYSVLIKNADQNEEEINFLKSLNYTHIQLPDNQALMVADDAPEDVVNAAQDAGTETSPHLKSPLE